tara:strand:- start:1448 stop:2878 length:1431 start_codon:yes stop_codon:yes gene_type:complete
MNELSYQTVLSYLDNCKEKLPELDSFMNEYKEIIELDKKKPRFSLTKRYSKFPKYQTFQRSTKYVKIRRSNNVWTPTIKMEISNKIKTILNKLTEHNYKKLCNILLTEIKLLDNITVFDILNKEILEKCTYDKEFHYIYIHLCEVFWNSEDIYVNYISVETINHKLYWTIKNDTTTHGPFNNKKNLHNNIKNTLSYKNKFLDYFMAAFKHKNQIHKDVAEGRMVGEEAYKEKIKIQAILQFIIKLYNSKNLTSTGLEKFLSLFLSGTIKPYDIEYLYNSLPLLKNYENINHYIMRFKKKINYNGLNKRIQFFADQICNLSTAVEIEEELDYEDYINIYIKNNLSLEELLEKLDNSYEIILSEMFYNYQNYQIYIDIIKDSYNKDLVNIDIIKEATYKIIQDYDELKIDIPKINIYFIKLLNDIAEIVDLSVCDNILIQNINKFLKESSKNELFNIIISDVDNVSDDVYESISKERI